MYTIFLWLCTIFHVLLDSSCADHCIRWACSDAKDIQFQYSHEHEHTDSCKDCNTITTLLEQICMLDLNEDEIVGVTDAKCSIESWKTHILRTINQDRGRTELLEGLNSHQILIVIDWAMRFLPLLHREKQSDWFGQKGISWHVAVGFTKDLDGSLKVLCFIGSRDKSQLLIFEFSDPRIEDWVAYCCLSVCPKLLNNIRAISDIA